jgi:hypothetical protein
MLQASILNVLSVFFRRMLQVCLFGCCICCTHMLQVLYLDVAHVLQCFFKCFSCVFASVSNAYFRCMFQVFQIYVSRVLDAYFKCFICLQTYVANVASRCFKSRSGIASPSLLSATSSQCLLLLPASASIRYLLPLFSMLVTFRGGAGLVWAHETAWKQRGGKRL